MGAKVVLHHADCCGISPGPGAHSTASCPNSSRTRSPPAHRPPSARGPREPAPAAWHQTRRGRSAGPPACPVLQAGRRWQLLIDLPQARQRVHRTHARSAAAASLQRWPAVPTAANMMARAISRSTVGVTIGGVVAAQLQDGAAKPATFTHDLAAHARGARGADHRHLRTGGKPVRQLAPADQAGSDPPGTVPGLSALKLPWPAAADAGRRWP